MNTKITIILISLAIVICLAAMVIILAVKPGTTETSTKNQPTQSQGEGQQEQTTPANSTIPNNEPSGQQTGAEVGNTAGNGQDGAPMAGNNDSSTSTSETVTATQTGGFGAIPTAGHKPLAGQCSDGTPVGQCSKTKPKLCFDSEIDLVDACHSCGCPAGLTCNSESQCQ